MSEVALNPSQEIFHLKEHQMGEVGVPITIETVETRRAKNLRVDNTWGAETEFVTAVSIGDASNVVRATHESKFESSAEAIFDEYLRAIDGQSLAERALPAVVAATKTAKSESDNLIKHIAKDHARLAKNRQVKRFFTGIVAGGAAVEAVNLLADNQGFNGVGLGIIAVLATFGTVLEIRDSTSRTRNELQDSMSFKVASPAQTRAILYESILKDQIKREKAPVYGSGDGIEG